MRSKLVSGQTRFGRPSLWVFWGAITALWMALYMHASWGFTMHNPLFR